MRKLIYTTLIIFYISRVALAQNPTMAPIPDLIINQDSSYSNPDVPINIGSEIDSIPEIFWNTKCIIGGWTKDNPLRDSTGLIICDSTASFIMPVEGKLLRGYSGHHSGWDIKVDAGTPVRAAMAGRVRYAHYCSGYGNLAIIRHKSGLEVYYSHLSKLKAAPDQYVEAGDTIGLAGATGHATTNHLHMEFRFFDRPFDISRIYTRNDSVIYLWKLNQSPSKENPGQNTIYHTVVRGDTLSKIARQHGTTVANLLHLNNLKYNSILRIGQKIRLS